MKQAIYIILVGLCLAVCPRVHAQGFTPSTTYKQIQYSSYSASGLHLQSDAFDRTHTNTSAFSLQQSGAPISTMQVGSSSQPIHVSMAKPLHFGVGAWQGKVTSVGSEISEAQVVKLKLPGKPGNPTHVPLGTTPWLLLSLLAIAYALRLSRRARKD